MEANCRPPPKWEGPPEDGLLRSMAYHRQLFGWIVAEALDPDYIEACREDMKKFFE